VWRRERVERTSTALGEDLDGVGGGPRWWWGRTLTVVEAHTEKERACSVNLDGGCVGGVDLDDGRMGGVDLDGGGGAALRCMQRRSGR
jgi:hypothetical protein